LEESFLTADDFRRADRLSDEELDRGVGNTKFRIKFNPKLYEGDIVKARWINKTKDVSIHTIRINSVFDQLFDRPIHLLVIGLNNFLGSRIHQQKFRTSLEGRSSAVCLNRLLF